VLTAQRLQTVYGINAMVSVTNKVPLVVPLTRI